MRTLTAALVTRLQRDFVFFPWKSPIHRYLCPPILFVRGEDASAQEVLFLNGLTSLSEGMLDRIETGQPTQGDWRAWDAHFWEKGWHEMDEEERREFLRERGEANPHWKPIPGGGYRYVGPDRNEVSRRRLSDVVIQPHFPQKPGQGRGDYERQKRRVARLDRLKDQRDLTPFEVASREKADDRLSHYRFFAMARASEEVALHGKDPFEAVLKYPEHHEALVQGKIPLDVYARGAQLARDSSDPKLLRTQLEHLKNRSVSPVTATGETTVAPIAKPLSQSAFQAATTAITQQRADLARLMAEQAMRAQQALPADQRLGYDQIKKIMDKRYSELSHEQLAAVVDPSMQRAIWGGPGSGKTTTTEGAVGDLLLNRQVKPDDLHFISTTRAGTLVLKQKMTDFLGKIFPQMGQAEYQNRHYRTIQSLALSQITRSSQGETSAVEQILGKHAQLLGAGKGAMERAESFEQALAFFEKNQEQYVRSLLERFQLDKKVSVSTAISQINRLKSNMGSDAYDKKLAEGKTLWEKGGASREQPHALLYAYEQALANQKEFAPIDQRQRRYDFHDAIDVWRQAGMRGITPKIGGLVSDESQELTTNMIRALWANTTNATPMLFAGDMGQRLISPTNVRKKLGTLRDRAIQSHELTANFRSSQQITAHARGIYEDPALQAYGTSHSQVAMSGEVGEEPRYLLGNTFEGAHAALLANWFREMGHDAESIRINLEYGQAPFAFGNRAARDMPIIVSQKEEREMIRKALATHLKGMGLSSEEIRQVLEQGVSEATPGDEGSRPDQLHIATTQQTRSQEFPVVFGSATRGGQWDDATWKADQAIKASRAVEQLYWFGTDKNFARTAFDNSFEMLPGSHQLVPAGYHDITARAARALTETQEIPLEELPAHLQMAAMAEPLGHQQAITPEQGVALWSAFQDAMDQHKAHPMIKRQALPVVGEGSGFLNVSSAEEQATATDQTRMMDSAFDFYGDMTMGAVLGESGESGESERAVLSGFRAYNGSAMAAANSDPSLLPDERLIQMAVRQAEQYLDRPGQTGDPRYQQEQFPIQSIAEFMDAARKSMGKISRDAYRGEDQGPDNIDLFNETLAQEAEEQAIKEGKKNDNDEQIMDLRPVGARSWGDSAPFLENANWFLQDKLALSDPRLFDALQATPTDEHEPYEFKTDHYLLEQPQLAQMARVARELAMRPGVYSDNPDEEQEIRARYTETAKQAEVFATPAPQWGDGVQMSEEEFAQIIQRDPRQANELFKLLGNPEAQPGEIDLLSPQHPEAKKQIGKHLAQVRYTASRVHKRREGHQLGIGYGYTQASPHMAEVALDAQRLQTKGIRDFQNVRTIPGDALAGIPEQTFQLGGTATLDQLERRLQDVMRLGWGEGTPEQQATLEQMRQVRARYQDPRVQEEWGHALNQVFTLATGNAPTRDPETKSGLSSEFHAFYAPMREASREGQRTFEQVQGFQQAMDTLTQDTQDRGVLNLGKVKAVLSAMGHQPGREMFKGLSLLKSAGFAKDSDDLPLHSITDERNVVDLLSKLPGAKRERLLEQFSRAPHAIGEMHAFHGGQPGFGGLTKQQRSVLKQLGFKPGETVKGVLRPISTIDAAGGAIARGGYTARQLFVGEDELNTAMQQDKKTMYPPLYQFEAQGELAGARFPVRSDQITSLDAHVPAAGGNGHQPPALPPVATTPEPEEEGPYQPGSALHPLTQKVVRKLLAHPSMKPGLRQQYIDSLPKEIRHQVTWALPKSTAFQPERWHSAQKLLQLAAPVQQQQKKEEKPAERAEPNLVPASYPRDMTSTQFLQQLAINPPAYPNEPPEIVKQALAQGKAQARPQHAMHPDDLARQQSGAPASYVSDYTQREEGEHVSPPTHLFADNYPAGVFTSPFSLPATRDGQGQGPGQGSSRGFVMASSLWQEPTVGAYLKAQGQHIRSLRRNPLEARPQDGSEPEDLAGIVPPANFEDIPFPEEYNGPAEEEGVWRDESEEQPPMSPIPASPVTPAPPETVTPVKQAIPPSMSAMPLPPPMPAGQRLEEQDIPQVAVEDQAADIEHWIRHGAKSNPKTYPEPTAEQLGVYDTPQRNLLVKAGPGSGKTHTIVKKSVLNALQDGKSARNWLFLSALHSGVSELNKKIDDMRPDLPQQHQDYQFPRASTFAALGRKIISKDAEPDGNKDLRYPWLERLSLMREQGPEQDRIFAPGVRWSGKAIHELSDQEQRELPPEQRVDILQPTQYLAQALQPHIQAMNLPNFSPTKIKEYLQHIEIAKSNRVGSPDDPYSVSYRQGLADLKQGRLSKDAALVLQQRELRQRGDLEFSDFPYLAREMINEHGMQGIPEDLQGLQGVTVDEGQDISHAELGMLGALMQTVKGNQPGMIVGYDPMQTSRSAFGGLDPHHIEDAYTHAIGPFEPQVLKINQRSNKGVVSFNNALLQHSELKKVAKSPIQEAASPDLGAAPLFHQAPHQPAMYQQMFDAMMKDAGLSWEGLKGNVSAGRHPLTGADFTQEGMISPGKIAAIFSQHRDRKGFAFETTRRFQQELGVNSQEAEELYKQVFQTDKEKPDANKFLTTLQAGARSHDFSRIHADVTHVGGASVEQYLQQMYIALSRANRQGQNQLYFTQNPFSKEKQDLYEGDPDLLQQSPEGVWNLGINEDNGRLRSISNDRRNTPTKLGGKWFPHHFAEPLARHVQDLLEQGIPADHPYFEQMGLADYAAQQARAIQQTTAQPAAPASAHTPPPTPPKGQMVPPPVAGHPPVPHPGSVPLHPADRYQAIRDALTRYPERLAGQYALEQYAGDQTPPHEWLAQEASHLHRLSTAIDQQGTEEDQRYKQTEVKGQLAHIAHFQANPHAFEQQAHQLMPTDDHDFAQKARELDQHPAFAGGKQATIEADHITITGGSGAMHIDIDAGASNVGMGGSGGKGTQPPSAGAPPPGGPPPGGSGPMMWDADKGGFAPRPAGGLNGQAMPAGFQTPATANSGQDKGPGAGGFNNQFVQAGRTFARIGDEMAYIGQHMQQTADSALQEGSQYRMATLQIPQTPGATTDTYGHTYATLTQGKKQTEQGAANVFSQIWNGITNPAQLGDQIGTALFGDPNNLTPAEKQKETQEQQNLGKDLMAGPSGWAKIWNEMVQGTQEQKTPISQKQTPQQKKEQSQSAAGDNGTQGFFDFTNDNDPNTIAYLQKNTLPMFSDTQIAQQVQSYLAATNQGFSRGAVGATTDIAALGAMTGMDTGSLTSQMTDITGMLHNAGAQNAAMQNLSGIMNTTFKGNMSEQNVSPYLSAMDAVIGNLQGINPASTQSQVPQAAAIFQMATNAGYSAQNLSETANLTNSLSGIGTNPNLHQQYALAQLFGAQNITAAPELAQYNQQMLGYQQQGAQMQLQQKFNVSQLQITADNAQIQSDKFSLQQASFNLGQSQASFNFSQWMQTQEYGPIGQDTSRTSYFDYLRRQQAAGYDPTNADSASTFKPSQPFGLQNEEFYAGIENQRSMLVLGRSPLLADAQFQQQMKYLNEQENFYERELALQNDQRAFEKTQGQQQLNMQAKALEIQKQQLPNQIAQLEYDKANAALQQKYLPLQMQALQNIVLNTQQSMEGQGPLNGKNVSPMQIISQLQSYYKTDASQGHQATLDRLQSMGLSTTDVGMLFNMLKSNQNLSAQQMIGMFAAQGDSGLLTDLQNLNAQGATASQAQTAGQANANLQQAGVGENWDQLIQTMNQDKDASNAVAQAMSGTTGLTKHIGDLTTALSPFTTTIGAFSNTLGAIAAFAGGGGAGGGGAGGGGLGMGSGGGMNLSGGIGFGEGGPSMVSPIAAPPPPPGGMTGNNLAEGTSNSNVLPGVRTNVLNFFEQLIQKRDEKRYGKLNQQQDAQGNSMNYGILTPHIIKDYRAAMNYGIHQGVDFAASEGTPLSAFFAGKVTNTGHFPWGGEVDLSLPGGYIQRYLHLSQIGVSTGQEVKQGQHIGATGGGNISSGLGKWSSGSHLHTQVDRGNINAGYDPWPIWQRLKAKNFVQDLTAATLNVSDAPQAGTPVNVPGNVASWISTAIALTNVPPNWLADLETIAMHESGGNPAAVNNWDINAQEGHPSQGLFQTIPSTFAAHMLPGYGNIDNPIDNSIAAIRYIQGRYGTVFNVPGIVSMANGGPYVGYADGGIATSKQLAHVAEKEPEAIIPLSKIQKVMASLASESPAPTSGKGSTTVSVQSLIGTAHFTVTVTGGNGKMTDSDKDELMSDLIGVLGDAARQMLGKV